MRQFTPPRLNRALPFAILLLSLLSCSKPGDCQEKAAPPSKPNSTAPIPAGAVMQDHIAYQFAIYYLPTPTNDPTAVLQALLQNSFPKIQRVTALKSNAVGICLSSQLLTNVQRFYSPPSLDSLKYFGRGLTREQALALQTSQHALLLNFSYPKAHVWDGLRSSLQLSSTLARQTGGILWDEATREASTADAWETNHLANWDTEIPDISKHTVMHAYRNDDQGFVRAITLGMTKFGLPDVVIEDFSWSQNRNIGHLINLFAQALAEGATISKPGEFDLDIRSIKNYRVRDPQISSLYSNATAKASLSLREGQRDDGDPNNRLIEITFDRYQPKDLHARQEELLSAMFGWEDQVTGVRRGDPGLLAASERARQQLPALREHFNKGMKPGEYISVKAPFPTPDHSVEYMWVEISSWKGDRIKGLLRNEPLHIPTLHGGQIVEVSERKVFDYIHTLPDGSQEGNETGKIIEAQEKSRN